MAKEQRWSVINFKKRSGSRALVFSLKRCYIGNPSSLSTWHIRAGGWEKSTVTSPVILFGHSYLDRSIFHFSVPCSLSWFAELCKLHPMYSSFRLGLVNRRLEGKRRMRTQYLLSLLFSCWVLCALLYSLTKNPLKICYVAFYTILLLSMFC